MPFITIQHTIFQGWVPGWRDEEGRPIIYDTEQDAELDALDAMHDEDDEMDAVVEVVVTPCKIYDAVDGRTYWKRDDVL